MTQKNFFKYNIAINQFGGSLLLKKRKSRRPLSVKLPLHLVLCADVSKIGSFLRHNITIEKTLQKYAKQFGVRIYHKATVQNHLHLVLKFNHRLNYQCFIRAVTGVLAKKLNIRWSVRPFSRIVQWGKDFKSIVKYVVMNELEAKGAINYQPRKKKYIPP
ncbi:MAG: hypothetical protein A2Z20_09705 [Bdellovibrionales bacterium RBG_16_40_8]|nr:MAG: hypothetical protein A2Z20_09705 [Bdellovibrionales bacterium RBG_16_40_8]